jgi:hypothetical protein
VPDTVGVPLIVIVLLAHDALTLAGKPLAPLTPASLMLDTPVVVCLIFVNAVLIHKVGLLEATPAVLFGVTTIVPVAFTLLQPPIYYY